MKYSHRLILILAGIYTLLRIGDLSSTYLVLKLLYFMPSAESNPISRWGIQTFGYPGFCLVNFSISMLLFVVAIKLLRPKIFYTLLGVQAVVVITNFIGYFRLLPYAGQ